ncbi:NADH-quinone oxidoreductase subunit J [Acidiferrobacter sp.]|uniref:NADH-quinone oxidoreductase subunit J n=1 Tax=Acidiferrobacter sp. TaxID=1872107 RepID=UPI00260E4B1A|nr:NADH-quinone oxidoreductase subunit J [Acidiferrobacter sp.]
MTFETAVFYLFSAILLASAAMVVTIRNPVKSVLFLVLAFVSAACLWILLHAEFLAIVLVLVYVGAVMVLFLFVVMMIDVNLAVLRQGFTEYLPVGAVVAVLMVVEIALVVGPRQFAPMQVIAAMAPAAHPHVSNTRALGLLLYTTYVYPFEIAAAILLVAIIAAIALTMRRRPDTKYQDPARQVEVRARDRVRLVKMPSEPKT